MIVSVVVILLLLIVAREVYVATHIQSCAYIKAMCSTSGNGVLLTFDDGPDEQNTPRVLSVLKKHNVKALFFCVGSEAEKNPELVKRIVSEGHTIGQHTYYHNPFHSFYSSDRYRKELVRAHEVFSKLGVEIRLFRPPLGITNIMIKHAVEKMNYKTIAWSVRSFDTRNESRDTVIRCVTNQIKEDSIILLHDRLDSADIVAEEIINEVNNRGWHFCNPQEIL